MMDKFKITILIELHKTICIGDHFTPAGYSDSPGKEKLDVK